MTFVDFFWSFLASLAAAFAIYVYGRLKAEIPWQVFKFWSKERTLEERVEEARRHLGRDHFTEYRSKFLSASFLVVTTTSALVFYHLALARLASWFQQPFWAEIYVMTALVFGSVGSLITLSLLGRIATINGTIADCRERQQKARAGKVEQSAPSARTA
ncbi:hypothetical protein GGQ73_004440 [Rhizobium skierniewicense]|uniref:DUF2721 domain-containing protein n=1 Tax=Rhizobium skierniewicense TaxID=984260 RepID=A0A7W6G3Q6_9HYPH|nr:hypothetical protein [Rhizobium skierniewicense]MBB3948453.1 hypothetical protein [Rhizobium skierniewicense]